MRSYFIAPLAALDDWKTVTTRAMSPTQSAIRAVPLNQSSACARPSRLGLVHLTRLLVRRLARPAASRNQPIHKLTNGTIRRLSCDEKLSAPLSTSGARCRTVGCTLTIAAVLAPNGVGVQFGDLPLPRLSSVLRRLARWQQRTEKSNTFW